MHKSVKRPQTAGERLGMPGAGALLALTIAALAGIPRSGGLVLPFSPGGSRGRAMARTWPHVRMQEACERPTRLVALSVGFVGSQYHGYQALLPPLPTTPPFLRCIILATVTRNHVRASPQADPSLPTIEQALRNACRAAAVAPFGRKIKPQHRWTASSRTDARVHAARIVITAPLWLPEESTGDRRGREGKRGRERDLVEALNGQLPNDIRVHAACVLPPQLAPTEAVDWTEREAEGEAENETRATRGLDASSAEGGPEGETRATRGLDARMHCSHREYSYMIPLAAIAAISPDMPISTVEALSRAQEVCKLFLGAQHFHNFCSPTRVPQVCQW